MKIVRTWTDFIETDPTGSMGCIDRLQSSNEAFTDQPAAFAARVRFRELWKAWIGVNLVNLKSTVEEAVINPPELKISDAKSLLQQFPMGIITDVFEFLLHRGWADQGGALFDDPTLSEQQMLRNDLAGNIERAILSIHAVSASLADVTDRDSPL